MLLKQANEPEQFKLPGKKIRTASYQRSETLQEIISNKPGFLIQWGNLFFIMILILLGTCCWFIKYPDTIKASAKLTSINAPKPVVSLSGGKLVRINFTEDQLTNQGDILGYMESTGDHKEVLTLSSTLDTIQTLLTVDKVDEIKKYFNGTSLSLGELQVAYQTFSQAFLSFKNYISDGFYLEKQRMLLKDKSNLRELRKSLDEQRELYEKDLAIGQMTFDANESLKQSNVISDFDYRNEQSKLLSKKLTLPLVRASMISNENQQMEKTKEILELENIIRQQKSIFQQALSTFKSQIDEWRRRYTLIAPISGKVTSASFIQENQQLEANQTICFVNPGNSKYFAEIEIPQANFGKVSEGQLVLLKFQSYPFQEYGSVVGTIDFISHIPSQSGYLAKVALTNGLKTNFNKQIQYRDGLLASAEIITRDMRLLERIYYEIVGTIRR